jgi:hypothetical protein
MAARNIFFSFDFDDVCASNIVRNSNIVRAENASLPFRDYSVYERVKNDADAVKRIIDAGLVRTSVTMIANGGNTYASRWVRYEIAKSLQRGNALMVVDVDGVGLPPKPTRGPNPLDYMAARPRSDGVSFDVLEWNEKDWVPFAKVPVITCDESGYSSAWCVGDPWKLSKHFTFSKHWNDLKQNLPLWAEVEAQAL